MKNIKIPFIWIALTLKHQYHSSLVDYLAQVIYRISSYSFRPWKVSEHLCTVNFGLWISKFKKDFMMKYGMQKTVLPGNCAQLWYGREKSKSMLFLKFLYSIQPVSAKFYRIYPDYFHQTGYFSHRPKSTTSARSLKVWRAKGLGKNYVYIFFHFLFYLFIAHFISNIFAEMQTQFGSVLFQEIVGRKMAK